MHSLACPVAVRIIILDSGLGEVTSVFPFSLTLTLILALAKIVFLLNSYKKTLNTSYFKNEKTV